MLTLDTLPKIVEFNGAHYKLNLSVINSDPKLYISYQFNGSPERAHSLKKVFDIFPQLVEPMMKGEITFSEDIIKSVDVPDVIAAFNTLEERLEKAIEAGKIKIISR